MEHCVQTLMNVVMVLTFVILVVQCVLMLWALSSSCKSGYAKNGTLCTDTDECAASTHSSHPDPALHTNALSSFTCSCKSGYARNVTVYTDIDECMC